MFWRHRYALILVFTACSATASDQPSATRHAAASHIPARKITVVGVTNFGEVTPHLFRGGQPKLVGYEHLKQMGIDMVVDLRLSGEDNERSGLQDVPPPLGWCAAKLPVNPRGFAPPVVPLR